MSEKYFEHRIAEIREHRLMKGKRFFLSVRPARECLFSRRNGYTGRVILGYSVVARLFGRDLI